MRRWWMAVLVLALLAAACGGGGKTTSAGGTSNQATQEPIKIGIVLPFTGLASFIGKDANDGLTLALKDINDSGGLLGREVQSVSRDDQNDPAKDATAVRELIENEHVAALFGPASSTSYLAIARIIQDAGVPAWVINSGPELTQQVNPFAFRAYLPDTAELDALTKYAATHYNRIAIVYINGDEGQAFRDGAAARLKALGKTVVDSETYTLDDTDLSPVVLKIKSANADAILLDTHLGLFAARLSQPMSNLGYHAQILGMAGLINYTYPDLARQSANGTIFVSFHSWGNLPKDQWPQSVRTFYDRYVQTYLNHGADEFSETGAYKAYSTNFLVYDMVQVWAAAVKQARSADPRKVDAVLNTNFNFPADKSVIGANWHYTSTNHDGIQEGELYFYRWELQASGKFLLHIFGPTTDVLSGKVKIQ